ncbi:hypothetical protein BV20DRAFT_1125975 [Pilatotrama ljubarskyi]|nr:hypothetical protein BV20DRAFT_1125975 [Pilatotrama ljubarskyi]
MASTNTTIAVFAQAGAPAASGSMPSAMALPSLDSTVGAILIGTFVSLILYGLVIHQAYLYFRMYQNDTAVIKTFVITMLVAETVHVIFCMHMIYYYLVTNYFNPPSLQIGVWSMDAQPVLNSFGIFVSKGFFTYRVYMISPKSRMLVPISILCTLFAIGCTSAATYESVRHVSFAGFRAYTWLDSAGFAATVASDILITSVLIFTLKRSRTGFKRTDHIVDRLILYTVNTGLLTSICNILALVLGLAQPSNMIYIGVAIISTKVYANSLLAALNTRRSLAASDVATSGGVKNATRTTNAEVWNVEVPTTTQDSAFKLSDPIETKYGTQADHTNSSTA